MDQARVVVKISAAAAVAWWIGNLAGQPRPVFAAIVPVLVIRSDTTATLRGSVGRVIGVLAGVGLGLAALEVISPTAIAVGVVMAIALALDRGLRAVPRLELDTRNQTAVSALLMLFVTTQTTAYAGTRAWETAVGAAVALGADSLDNEITRRVNRRAEVSGQRSVGGEAEATGSPPMCP
jgi:uncharacterized membrane protein YgaE (UPF0421/DUF939 family)